MVTVCWAAKGGSGTTVAVASLALVSRSPVLVVDLAGDLPVVLGLAEPAGPGVHDWLGTDAPASGLDLLTVAVTRGVHLLPAGSARASRHDPRWRELARALGRDERTVLIDAGTGAPPPELVTGGARSLLVTRACFVALRRAVLLDQRPTAVVFVHEPGRALRAADVEQAIGAPVVATITLDPAIARAVDAGLLASRLPRGIRHHLRGAA